MGFFDFLSKGKASGTSSRKVPSDREIQRLGKVCADKLAQNYDRQEAITQLGRVGNEASAAALLKRFDWSMEPSITDQDEKEAAAKGIVSTGEVALGPIREYCARAESLTWALKVLRQIVDTEQYPKELLGLLGGFDTEYRRNAEPKIQLIAALAEHAGAEVREAVVPFLDDANETVRFQAVTTLFALGDEEAYPAMAKAMLEEESLRIKNRISAGFVDKEWSVPTDLLAPLTEVLPPDFRLSGQRLVRA